MPIKKFTPILALLLFVGAIFYSFYSLTPQKSWKPDTILPGFSVDRALSDLKNITQEVHFPGVVGHDHVRNYIKAELEAVGLEVEIQEQVAVNNKWRAGTKTKNILARIPGTESGKALLLLSHYDSNPHSALGASDAGSGVVIIMEGVRALLSQNNRPKNDIIICLSDAEELGLLGANAFVNHHPWAKDIGLVLNLEARGSGGPSYMLMETNGGNKKLLEAFDRAAVPFPVANSLMYSIYKMLPNDTDLTVFREDADIDGFNFAFIGDHFDYHTAQDSFERMDHKSFLHQTSYLLAGLTYFSNADLNDLKASEDYVYFNFPLVGMVFYPFSWVMPWAIICSLIVVVLLFLGISRLKLTLAGMLKGFIPLGLSLIVSSIIAVFGWKLLSILHPTYVDILHGFTYNGYYYIAFFVLITCAICFWVYARFVKKRSAQDLLVAPLILWMLINLGLALYLKGAGFFIIVVCALLIQLAVLIFNTKKSGNLILFTVLSIPTILIFSPLIKMLPVGLGLKMLVISTLFTSLVFAACIPVFHNIKNYKNWAKAFGLFALVFLIIAETKADYNGDRKKPNSIIYFHDNDTNEAFWGTYNHSLDDFTKQFFKDKAEEGSYDRNTTASKYKTSIRQFKTTSVRDLPRPIITITSDTLINGHRKIRLNISSLRAANKIELLANEPIKFRSFIVNKEALKKSSDTEFVLEVNKGTIMSYFLTSPDEQLNLEFLVNKDQQIDIDILEAKFDLLNNPEFEIVPRSNAMIPMPFVLNDATIIKTNLKF